MNLFNIPPGVPFLDAVATEWLDAARHDPLVVSQGLILLPTRRAARALADAFLRASGGRPLLLPRITAPALLIQGQSDPYFSLGQLERIARAVANTRRLELADCGHAPYRERTNTVLETAAAFLQRVG